MDNSSFPLRSPSVTGRRRATVARCAGQGLVEFVLVSVIVLILTMGLADVGRMYYTFLALQTAAGEGVSFAQVYPSCVTPANCANPDNVTFRVQNSAPRAGLVDWSHTSVVVDAPHGSAAGQPIDVVVRYEYRLIAPLMNVIVGGDTFEMQARASAVILR